eukprot:1732710-Rhodomonas_salina.2
MSEKEDKDLKSFSKFHLSVKNWPAWKQDINTKTSVVGCYNLIMQFGVECAKEMISQWERAMQKQCENFTTDLDNYPAHQWTEWEKCGFSTEEAYAKQVKRIHLQFLIKINRVVIERILTSIYGADTSKKGSREAEALLKMLITPAVKELLSGSVNAETWEERPDSMLAVQMWAKLCFKYKGVSDINSKNLLKDLNAQYQCCTEVFIDVKAANAGPDQKGYMEACDYLLQKRSACSLLLEDLLDQAIKLAEDYNLQNEKDAGALDKQPAAGNDISVLKAMVAQQSKQLS